MTSFDEDMTAQLDAHAPSLPRPAAEQVPRVVPPVTEAEIEAVQTANMAMGVVGYLARTGASATIEGLARDLGEDVDRLAPALKLAVDEGRITQTGELYETPTNAALGGWNRR